jgi:hypothetical protein
MISQSCLPWLFVAVEGGDCIYDTLAIVMISVARRNDGNVYCERGGDVCGSLA